MFSHMEVFIKNMLRLRLICFLSVLVLHLSTAQRKVLDGKTLTKDRRYVVYMIKANSSVLYDAWMCGGAIVSRWYIVTSAACVEDVKYMYAIAGYTKYVKYDNLNRDPCTSRKKKKIVYVCLPSEYDFDYPRVEQWANIDIALARVESRYDFTDSSYRTHCSYAPNSIEINYDPKLQEPGINALVFGWGHRKRWRSVEDHKDYNTNNILYGAVKLARKEECKTHFDEVKIKKVIDKYMICSMEEGNLDDAGGLNKDNKFDSDSFKTNCAPGTLRMGDECIADYTYRRDNANESIVDARRRGICQNDHGGPLITWRGPREVLIGIASVFKVQHHSNECIAPFLYTSTHCNGAFINCLMNEHTRGRRQFNDELIERCNTLARQGGYKIIRRSISWSSHPDGPAENEIPSVARQSPDKAFRKTEDESDNTDIRKRPIARFEYRGA